MLTYKCIHHVESCKGVLRHSEGAPAADRMEALRQRIVARSSCEVLDCMVDFSMHVEAARSSVSFIPLKV
jgi:hypothetical protein